MKFHLAAWNHLLGGNDVSLIGNSEAFRKVLDAIAEVCESRANVLLTGESGTGKELVARAIHYRQFPSGQGVCRKTGLGIFIDKDTSFVHALFDPKLGEVFHANVVPMLESFSEEAYRPCLNQFLAKKVWCASTDAALGLANYRTYDNTHLVQTLLDWECKESTQENLSARERRVWKEAKEYLAWMRDNPDSGY